MPRGKGIYKIQVITAFLAAGYEADLLFGIQQRMLTRMYRERWCGFMKINPSRIHFVYDIRLKYPYKQTLRLYFTGNNTKLSMRNTRRWFLYISLDSSL